MHIVFVELFLYVLCVVSVHINTTTINALMRYDNYIFYNVIADNIDIYIIFLNCFCTVICGLYECVMCK